MIEKMTKYNFILLNEEQEVFLQKLQEMGAVNVLVSLAGIDDMEPEQCSEEIINRVTARYEFMKALSTAPIQFLCRVYPEIAAAINCEKEVSENRKSIAKAMRE